MGLVDLITEMLGWVRDAMDALDDDRKAIVIADRGIGNSPNLIREIVGLGMFCLMRVTKKVRVMMEGGEVSPFDELSDAPGTSWRRKARAFKKSGRIEALGGARAGLRPRGAVVFGDELPGVGGQRVWYSHVDRADV